jgi:hypothetical protein
VSWFADAVRRDLAREGVVDEGYEADVIAQLPKTRATRASASDEVPA